MSTFRWNGNWGDKEQVRSFLAEYAALRESGLFYNSDFEGRIPALAGSPDEGRAIYLLSSLWAIEREQEKIAEARSSGYVKVERGEPDERRRYARIIVYRPGHYVGGTGLLSEYEDARLVFDAEGAPLAVLPKGRRTRGYDASNAEILVTTVRGTDDAL
jgi:hypothetical protein